MTVDAKPQSPRTPAAAKRRQRMIFAGGALAVAALATALVLTALRASVAYFYTPSDLAIASNVVGQTIRLGGLVRAGSVRYPSEDDGAVRFIVEDAGAATDVIFAGVLPDLFRDGQGVVVQGRVRPDGVLAAADVLAKHDETYMPREVAEALKEQGVWQGDGTPPRP